MPCWQYWWRASPDPRRDPLQRLHMYSECTCNLMSASHRPFTVQLSGCVALPFSNPTFQAKDARHGWWGKWTQIGVNNLKHTGFAKIPMHRLSWRVYLFWPVASLPRRCSCTKLRGGKKDIESHQWRWRSECNPSLSVISAAFIALGRSCLFAKTSRTASRSSSCKADNLAESISSTQEQQSKQPWSLAMTCSALNLFLPSMLHL